MEQLSARELAFRATISDISLFRDAISALSDLISEGIFRAKNDGIYFTATDPTMVTLVDFKFMASNFDKYEVDGEKNIAVNLDNVIQVLKRAKAADSVSFELDEKANKLSIIILGASTRKFVIPLLDIDRNEVPQMNLDFPATIEVKARVLSEGLADAEVVTDTIILEATKDHFAMHASGDLSQVENKFDKTSQDIIGMHINGDARAKYSLDYMKKIEKGSKLSDTCRIQFGKDYPIKVTFKAPEKAELSYILAPRVED